MDAVQRLGQVEGIKVFLNFAFKGAYSIPNIFYTSKILEIQLFGRKFLFLFEKNLIEKFMSYPRQFDKTPIEKRLNDFSAPFAAMEYSEEFISHRALIGRMLKSELIRILEKTIEEQVSIAVREVSTQNTDIADGRVLTRRIAKRIALKALFGQVCTRHLNILHHLDKRATAVQSRGVGRSIFSPSTYRPFAFHKKYKEELMKIVEDSYKLALDSDADCLAVSLTDRAQDLNSKRHEIYNVLYSLINFITNVPASSLYWTLCESTVYQRFPSAGSGIPSRIHFNEFSKEDKNILNEHIFETLRLYPPAFSLGRIVRNAETADGESSDLIRDFKLKNNDYVVVPLYVLHRHSALWNNPLEYMPERWRQISQPLKKDGYLPFGYGSRQCLGMASALHMIQAVIRCISRDYHVYFTGDATDPRYFRPRVGLTSTSMIPTKTLNFRLVSR